MSQRPNILVLGTPGTGKTTLCERLQGLLTGFSHLSVSETIRTEKLYEEWDDEYNAAIMDDDRVGDRLEEILTRDTHAVTGNIGGRIVEFHSCDFMDPDWFALVIILRASTETLYDRLAQRGYPEAKVRENVESEIFGIVLEEAYETFRDENGEGTEPPLLELTNNSIQELEENVKTILAKVQSL